MKQGGSLGKLHVGIFISAVELAESEQFNALFHKCFDNGNARKAFLREIGKCGKGILSCIPFFGHILADNGARKKQKRHRDQGKQSKKQVHSCHFDNGDAAKQRRIEEHHKAPTEALLHGIEVVGKQRHHIADFIFVVIMHGKILGSVEHLASERFFGFYACAKKAHAPQKSAHDHCQNDTDHRQTNVVKQKRQIESM